MLNWLIDIPPWAWGPAMVATLGLLAALDLAAAGPGLTRRTAIALGIPAVAGALFFLLLLSLRIIEAAGI